MDRPRKMYIPFVPKNCAGYEIGWEYVDAVNFGKQTFSGFVKVTNSKCQMRRILPTHFMELPRFIEWWFGCTSRRKLDFRRKC